MSADEVARELDEIRYEMEQLIEEAYRLVRNEDDRLGQQAKGYWYAHMLGALNRETQFLGNGSMVCMEDTIEGLERLAEDVERRPR